MFRKFEKITIRWIALFTCRTTEPCCSLVCSVLNYLHSKFVRLLASVTVALQILTKGEVVDDWFQLRASHSRNEAGTIRIKARYMVSGIHGVSKTTELLKTPIGRISMAWY